ncbi:hypothetical protein CMI47_20575 [Candidatus Pacearchaeota archaeon]|nr:hypothetical protein [Candidatus Pacearchaeota archaeon]|tara:strand:- start:4256 stop:4444 length:189 start_codon:yes stop_codon:yes gene_type:complete
MEHYENKAICGITSEVTIAQIEALAHGIPGLKEAVLQKLIIGMDSKEVQAIVDKINGWNKKK